MEFEIAELVEPVPNVDCQEIVKSLGEIPEEKINVQIFKIDDLKQCLECIKLSCIIPLLKKMDFETLDKVLISYRSIFASLVTLEIGQHQLLKL